MEARVKFEVLWNPGITLADEGESERPIFGKRVDSSGFERDTKSLCVLFLSNVIWGVGVIAFGLID